MNPISVRLAMVLGVGVAVIGVLELNLILIGFGLLWAWSSWHEARRIPSYDWDPENGFYEIEPPVVEGQTA